MKRKNSNNKVNKKISEIRSILDPNYFHISVEVKKNEEVEWTVYYNNLPAQTYWSTKNKPLLTSDRHTIRDIYRLKDKFEREKRRELQNNMYEFSKISYAFFISTLELKRTFINMVTNLMLLMCIVNLVNAIFIKDLWFSVLSLNFVIISAILQIISMNKVNNQTKKNEKKLKEIFIKEKIRRQGLYFVNKLRQ